MMLLRAAGAVGNGYFITYTGIFVVQAIQIDVFKKVQAMPLAFFQRYNTGELIAAIMGYPNQIKQVLVNNSNDLIKQPLTLLSAIGFLVYKSFTNESFFTAVIGVLSIPIIIFPIRRIGRYLAKRSKQLVMLGEGLSASTIEAVQSPIEIRAYNLEQQQNQRFMDQLSKIFRISMKSVRTSLIMSPLIEVVAATGLGLSLFLGVRTGMEQGEFLALAVALYMAYAPIK
jgi:subfamily B ATP-binding cassette protein MsbA